MAESNPSIVVEWRYESPCTCGQRRWWMVIANRDIGWVHKDGTLACAEGA